MEVLTIVEPEQQEINNVIKCFETALERAKLSPEEAGNLDESIHEYLRSILTEAYKEGLKEGHTSGYQQAREDYEI